MSQWAGRQSNGKLCCWTERKKNDKKKGQFKRPLGQYQVDYCLHYRGSRRRRVRVRKYLSRKHTESNTRWTQMKKIKDGKRILKAGKEKQQVANKGTPIKLSADFSAETLQARNAWHDIFKVIKGKNLQPRIPYPTKLSFRFWWRNQKLYRQTKSKRIQHPTRFTINANWNSSDEKKRLEPETRQLQSEKSSLAKANI